jgi:hypothetical protein
MWSGTLQPADITAVTYSLFRHKPLAALHCLWATAFGKLRNLGSNGTRNTDKPKRSTTAAGAKLSAVLQPEKIDLSSYVPSNLGKIEKKIDQT